MKKKVKLAVSIVKGALEALFDHADLTDGEMRQVIDEIRKEMDYQMEAIHSLRAERDARKRNK